MKNRATRTHADVIYVGGKTHPAGDIEALLVKNAPVAEAVAIDAGKTGLALFLTLEPGFQASDILRADIRAILRREIGEGAVPGLVHFGRLPRTPAGEIVRPILQRIAEGKPAGDVSGLEEPGVVDEILKSRAETVA
ncbi:AMP-binding enzyme [Phenylobacterium sp. VNQ135]|uniref:AMP-binding enzyme n=1 Tax=Phenylobacterium sp. VNQ135 TaxID=3400922 RepID=UPI003C0AB60A